MRFTIAFAALSLALARAAPAQTFEFKMISSGSNRPGIAVWNPPYRDILIALHAGATLRELPARVGLDRSRLAAVLDSLRTEGVLRDVNGSPHPTCMVITAGDGAPLAQLASDIARPALPFVRKAVQDARARHPQLTGIRHLAFDDVSFFLASDVLLDNWQINAVERRWLQADRPLRRTSHYYCAFLERTRDDREAFGIYGNQMMGLGQGRFVGVYGNRRGRANDLISLSQSRLAELMALPDTMPRQALLNRLADQLVQSVRTRASLAEPLAARLGQLGLMRDTQPLVAVLDTADNRVLSALAASVTDSLVAHLNNATPRLRDAWSQSVWANGTSFEEFRIWWYHLFYTALTDQLAGEGTIRVPATGLFHYLMIQ